MPSCSEHLPEAPAEAVAGVGGGRPRSSSPSRSSIIGEVVGLMEIVRDNAGQMDVFRLDALTEYDFGHTLAVVKVGEMLDFLDTPKNRVVLTPLGGKFLDADINGRKLMFNQQLQTLGVFRFIVQILKEAQDQRLPQEVVQEELAMRLPTEDVEALTKTLIGWGRFAELLGYSPEEDRIYLDHPAAAPA
jgi:NitT/TauT family transport system ATP-binding protein